LTKTDLCEYYLLLQLKVHSNSCWSSYSVRWCAGDRMT